MNDARHDPEATRYDLRTATQAKADELASLRLRLDELADALAYLTGRVATLETHDADARRTLEHHADALQVLVLRGERGK